MTKEKPKTVKAIIRSNEKTFIGKRLVFGDFHRGYTVGVITNVTHDRVVYMDEENKEGWSWICPNGQFCSYDILNDGHFGEIDEGFNKALELEEVVKTQRDTINTLNSKIRSLEKAQKIIDLMDSLEGENKHEQ